MPLCRFLNAQGQDEYALYRHGEICPLSSLGVQIPVDTDPISLGQDWVASLPVPTAAHWIDAPSSLLPPVPHPGKVICIGLNYRDHAIETGSDIPTEPVVFSKFSSTVIGHGDEIQLPIVSSEVDYEAELVVVIGKTARHVATKDAMDFVYGYTCGHDVSARDWQKGRPGGQWLLGKTFDTFAPTGPCVVTTRELIDPSDLRVRMHLNGSTVQDSTTAQLIFDIPTLIAHLSKIVTLQPGDLIFTGTPPGVGAAMNPPRYLQKGDSCTVEIEGIGVLTNACVDEAV
ncbi:fumarylacetoacetate hydrolase family protein [bacterium]|nr:fumarylacetoacetate hydrolase family protein [bacterium]